MFKSFGARLRARLIPDLRHAWRYSSLWISAAGAALMTSWYALPDGLRESLPYSNQIAGGMFLASMAARLLNQRTLA